MYGDAGLEYAFAPFPYGEDAYEEWIDGWDDDGDEIDNGVLLEKYPEALEWHILNEARQMVLDEQIADEANLRVCPICRRWFFVLMSMEGSVDISLLHVRKKNSFEK